MTIAGFRGAPIPVTVRLGDHSLCLLAENGHGKSTLVDALEFWSTGDVAQYHSEGYRLDSVVNLDAASASVTCEATGHPPLKRELTGSTAGQLVPIGPRAVDAAEPGEIPILRHRAMAAFMTKTPGEKKAVLLALFDLGALTEFRSTLKTAANEVVSRTIAAQRELRSEKAALDVLLAGRTVIEAAEALRVAAGLDGQIATVRALLDFEVVDADRSGRPDRVALVQSVARALEGADDDEDAVSAWNQAVADRSQVVQEGLAELLRAGERVLSDWGEDTCPLCLQDKDRVALLSEAVQRADQLARTERALADAKTLVNSLITRRRRLVESLSELTKGAPEGGWAEPAKIDAAVSTLNDEIVELQRALSEYTLTAELGSLALPAVDELEASARAGAASDKSASVAAFVRLQGAVAKAGTAAVKVQTAARDQKAVEQVLDVTDRRIREAIEEELTRIGSLAARYYGMLVSNPVYSNVTIEYVDRRAGGVEFSVVYDGRHTVSPPQRILSESQLNALGLALFLARLRDSDSEWRTLVLDDVVNSFDMNHRQALAHLLTEEFHDWQIICVTHDRVFVDVARRTLGAGWRYQQVVAWSPAGGPVLLDGNALEQLRTKLAEGRAAIELGALGRVALEQALSKPLERLGLPIRYDPHYRHAAQELLAALRTGLRSGGCPLADARVLGRIEADVYLMNLGSHDRPVDPALTTDDLRRLVVDLDELAGLWICNACQDPVWTAVLDGGRHHQCTCGALAV